MSRALWKLLVLAVGGVAVQLLLLHTASQYQSEVLVKESDLVNQQQLPQKARQLAWDATRLNPFNGYAHFYVGTNEYLLHHYPQAVEALEQAQLYMPHQPNVLRLLAQTHLELKQHAKAAEVFDTYYRMEPHPRLTPDTMLRLRMLALFGAQHYGAAAAELASAEKYERYRPEMLQLRVLDAAILNQLIAADAAYRRMRFYYPARRLDPAWLFSETYAAGKIASALRFLEMVRMRGDVDPGMLKAMAMAYIRLGRSGEAITVLNQAKALAPKDAELYLILGDAYFHAKDMPRARESYRTHLSLAPTSSFRKDILQRFGGMP